MSLSDISDLVQRFYKLLGYDTDLKKGGLLEITPTEKTSKLIGFKDKEILITKPTKLAFNLKTAKTHDIEFITLESPRLLKIIDYIERFGRIGKAYIPFFIPNKETIFDYILKKQPNFNIKDSNYKFKDVEINYGPFIIFDFRISLKSLEKNEILDTQIIPIYDSDRNETYMQYIQNQIAEKYPKFSETPPYRGKLLKMNPHQLENMYNKALQQAESSIQEKKEMFDKRINTRLKKELDLLYAYYNSRMRELKSQIKHGKELLRSRDRTKEYQIKKQAQIKEFESELARIDAEKDRKIEELEEIYGTTINYELASVAILYSPIDVLIKIEVKSEYGTFDAGLQYNYSDELLFPFKCDCGNVVTSMSLHVCSKLHLCCGECLDKCVVCNETLCRNCGMYCESCNQLYCEKHVDKHFVRCELCNQLTCKHELIKCQECGRKVCSQQCIKTCSNCGGFFCVECIKKCDICDEFVCSQDLQVCENCNKSVCRVHRHVCASCGKEFCTDCLDHCEICTSTKSLPRSLRTARYCVNCQYTCEKCGALVCKEHENVCSSCGKIVCSKHSTTCKICGNVFCTDCLVSCTVCNQLVCKKCATICEISGDIICFEHAKKCFNCNKTVKTSLIVTCQCGKDICEECALFCSECNRALCNDCANHCDFCDKILCNNDVNICSVCGAKMCSSIWENKKLKSKGHSYVCSVGFEYVCPNCIQSCPVCGKLVCKEHLHSCSKCNSIACDNCLHNCTICGSFICEKCAIKCHICGEYFCKEHMIKCEACGTNTCPNDFKRCNSCEQLYCKKHFIRDNYKCEACSSLRRIGKLRIKILDEKYLLEINAIKSWKMGKNEKFKIYIGKTLKYQIVIVSKNRNREQIIIKKDTFLGKLIRKVSRKFKHSDRIDDLNNSNEENNLLKQKDD
ncbi:MAG: hypothetical protein ACTSVE_10090 [Candidatus Helarchaeota archaeon]